MFSGIGHGVGAANGAGGAKLARHLRWQEVARVCHRSFAPFAAEIRDDIGPLYGIRDED